MNNGRWLGLWCAWMVFVGCSCSSDDEEEIPRPAPPLPGTWDTLDGGIAAACFSPECSLLEGGCRDGEGCQYLKPPGGGDPYPLCQPAGSGEDEEACTLPTDCAPGFGCNSHEIGGDGACHPYCCTLGEQGSCPDEQRCLIALGTGVGFCSRCHECDPLTAEGCDEGQGCYQVESDCRLCMGGANDGDVGSLCTHANDCRPGTGCYRVDDTIPRCRAYCDPAADDPCAGDLVCDESLGVEGLGLCIPEHSAEEEPAVDEPAVEEAG